MIPYPISGPADIRGASPVTKTYKLTAMHAPPAMMDALNGLATGQVSLRFAALPLALPYLSNGRLMPLGIASRDRFKTLPKLATLRESGLPEFEAEACFGFYGRRACRPRRPCG